MYMRFIPALLLCVGFFMWRSTQAQELTANPYSRFGVGDIFDNTTTRNAAMGGISYATNNYFSINRVNPASAADLIFTTMDISVFGQVNELRTEAGSQFPVNAGFQNLSFGFPANKGPVITMGFAPFSATGFEVINQSTVNVEDTSFTFTEAFNGKGGINQVFIGAAFKLLNKKLRIGANGQYYFGNTTLNWNTQLQGSDTSSVPIPGYQIAFPTEDIFTRGVGGSIGAIYLDTINPAKNVQLRVGGAAEGTLSLRSDRFLLSNVTSNLSTTSVITDTLFDREDSVNLPLKWGVGVLLSRPGRWAIGADFSYQNWESFTSFSDSSELGPEYRISIGGEYTPDFESFKYFQRINYRLGGYFKQTYIRQSGNPVYDYGVTFGLGLPASVKGNSRFNRGRAVSGANISIELGRRGGINAEPAVPLQQLYARIRLGFNLNEQWFIRRVVD